MAHALTIGQLAKATGVAAKTIRFYEQIGVLPTPNRTAAGYRQYDQSGVQRLRFIRRARSLGLPLRDVKTVIVGLDGGPGRASSSAGAGAETALCGTAPVLRARTAPAAA